MIGLVARLVLTLVICLSLVGLAIAFVGPTGLLLCALAWSLGALLVTAYRRRRARHLGRSRQIIRPGE